MNTREIMNALLDSDIGKKIYRSTLFQGGNVAVLWITPSEGIRVYDSIVCNRHSTGAFSVIPANHNERECTQDHDGADHNPVDYETVYRMAKRVLGLCTAPDCPNKPCPHDDCGECLSCNPFGDSLAMNNDPE